MCLLQEGSIYDYLFDKPRCGWRHWMDTVPVQEVPTSAAFHEITVQTVDTVRYTYLLNMLLSHGHHTTFTGGLPRQERAGCGSIAASVAAADSCQLTRGHAESKRLRGAMQLVSCLVR